MVIKKIKTLGCFTVYSDKNEVHSINSRKVTALLIYLIWHKNTPLSRARLASLLWENCDEQHARGNLRQALLKLRPQLPKGCLEISYQHLLLNTESLDIDLEHFKSLSQHEGIQELEQVTQLYDGEFMRDFYSYSIEFDHWLDERRLQLCEVMRSVVLKLLDYYLEQKRIEKAVLLVQSILSFDPLNEEMHYLLMKLYVQQGRRAEAIKQYQRCQQLLREELNLQPSVNLQTFYNTISSSQFSSLD